MEKPVLVATSHFTDPVEERMNREYEVVRSMDGQPPRVNELIALTSSNFSEVLKLWRKTSSSQIVAWEERNPLRSAVGFLRQSLTTYLSAVRTISPA